LFDGWMSKELSARRFEEKLLRLDFVGLFKFEIPNYVSNILVEFQPKIFEIVVLEIAKASQKNKHAGMQKEIIFAVLKFGPFVACKHAKNGSKLLSSKIYTF
jgi:hypothetical protein